MTFLDPLKIKIAGHLLEGKSNILTLARNRYGTEDDINELLNEAKAIKTMFKQFIFIDFTPFSRAGHLKYFLSELSKIEDSEKFVLLLMHEGLLSDILNIGLEDLPLLVLFDNAGKVKKYYSSKGLETIKTLVSEELKRHENSLRSIRLQESNLRLTKLLSKPGAIIRPSDLAADERVRVGSGEYIEMPNGMLVSCYINIKEIVKDFPSHLTISYESLLAIMEYFRRDVSLEDEIDYFIAPNNTAYFVGFLLQLIFGKEFHPIDRLGPIPTRRFDLVKLQAKYNSKRVILIEEVVGTGSEIDRSLLLLSSAGALVKKIIAVYNLEVGSPLLVEDDNLISLCKPKAELEYVYRSK